MKKILVGRISSAFGVRGELRVFSFCKNPFDIAKYKLFDKNNNSLEIKITNKNPSSIKYNAAKEAIIFAKFAGYDDRTQAEKLRNLELYTNREDFSELPEDEFYYVDLVGLDVICENKKIGKVLNVLDFGGGVMLEIEFEKEDLKLGKIENFPFKNEFFPKVDIKAGFIEIKIPDYVTTQ